MRSQVNISSDLIQSLSSCLEELCRAVNAQQAILFNPMGQTIVCHGGTGELDLGILVPLIANGIAAIQEASSLIEQEEGFTLYYHAGNLSDLYGASINRNLMILLKLDRPQNQTRIGAVWFYLQQAIRSLRTVLPEPSSEAANDLGDQETMEQPEPVMRHSVPTRSEEIVQNSSETAAEPGIRSDGSATRPGQLLSYGEAETQGLLRSDR